MFTGIVATKGRVAAMTQVGEAMRLKIECPALDMSDVALGDSIAVSGPCLTVVSFASDAFEVDVSMETLKLTTLGDLTNGSEVNLEKALRVDERLGGHLVSGHVDGIGVVQAREDKGEYVRFEIEVPEDLARYLAFKGSVCVDGVSLTVNAVNERNFEILLIPHTLERTSLGRLQSGVSVNIEVDLIARYIERLLGSGRVGQGVSLESLIDAGFVRPE